MAKKKQKLTKDILIDCYTEHVLEHGGPPKSVYTFAKENGFAESEFYSFFGSFQAIDKAVFSELFSSTLQTLNQSKEYRLSEAKTQLLSFYFTFIENLTANRSLIKYLLEKEGHPVKNLSVFKELRPRFKQYIGELNFNLLDFKEERLLRTQHNALQETAWAQLLLIIKFWLDDESVAFEKTDILIEKAVNTSFDIMNIKPIQSLIDFGKFLLQERGGINYKNSAE